MRSQPILGLTTTFCPGFTKAVIPPNAAIPRRNISTGEPLRTTATVDFALASLATANAGSAIVAPAIALRKSRLFIESSSFAR